MRFVRTHARSRVAARVVAILALATGSAPVSFAVEVSPVVEEGARPAEAAGPAEGASASERRALSLVYEGRCDEALPEIAAVRRADDSARMAQVDGQCRLRLRDYSGAVDALDDAKRMDPDLEDVDVYRGVALYKLEDFEAAQRALDEAKAHTSRQAAPQRELYTGLLLLRDRKNREAAQTLDRARVLDPGQVEPVASFYAGLAWQAVGERDLARESLLRVKAADPDGPWGKRAAELLSGQGFDERSWASLTVGLEYDSNVVLLGESVPSPAGISDQSDGRAAWFLEGGAELFNKGKFSGGLAASYAGNAQFHLSEFDIQYPRATGWVDYELSPKNLLRARYGFGHAWVNYARFLITQDATLSLYRNWGQPGNTEFGVGWVWNDYKFFVPVVPEAAAGAPAGTCGNGANGWDPVFACVVSGAGASATSAKNRDGNSIRPYFLHRYRVQSIDYKSLRDVELRGGYGYERYWAHGTDWDFQSHDFVVGAKALLFWGIQLDSQIGYSYRPYTYASSYPTPPVTGNQIISLSPIPREDQITNVIAVLEKPISDHWSVLTRYSYTRASSNVAVFDYSRNIIGGYAKYRF